jgi:hypothetical protein
MKPRDSERSVLFETLYLICSACFVAGVFIDGWAHNHIPELETFFTPWHGLFYGGYLLTAVTLLAWIISRHRNGGSWKEAVPAGHGLSVIGVELFFLGGIGDLIWHTVFGIEADIQALLSPTHLVLATSLTLIATGGMRHYWRTRAPSAHPAFLQMLPVTLSLTLGLAVILFMTQFGHYTDFEAVGLMPKQTFYPQGLPILGILLFSASLIGALSIPLRREPLPLGAVTFLLVTVVAGLSLMRSGIHLIPSAVVAGACGDLALLLAERSPYRKRLMHVFAFCLPALFYALVFITLIRTQGIWWSVHVWTGAIVMAGFSGLLTSLIVWPPRSIGQVRG